MKKKIGIALLVIIVAIQFVRPARNKGAASGPTDIASKYPVPKEVAQILEKSCYDCHSNHTVYPWYTNIQPVGWWMQWHVNEGKQHLNYSEFATYDPKKTRRKFRQTIQTIKEDEMPLNSFLWIHRDAILSDQQKQVVMQWADSLQKQITIQYNLPEQDERGGPPK